MTALKDFQRLESPGIWRASPQTQRQDAIVSLGEATLTITGRANQALAHWSLPAIRQINPGERPALYQAGEDLPETLELDDEVMINAISRVHAVVERSRPRPGRLRLGLISGIMAVIVLGGFFWLPGAMIAYSASVVPEARRIDIGEALLASIRHLGGASCDTVLGERALVALHDRLLGAQAPGRIVVLAAGVQEAEHLPGGIILVNRALVEDFEEPDVVAGFVLAEDERARRNDPLLSLLKSTGLVSALGLLTTGDIPRARLAEYAEALLTADKAPVETSALIERFATARLRASPYAYARDMTGETTIDLIEADPVPIAMAEPILRDSDWVSLQGICGE